MTTERYDIEVTDKVDGAIPNKLRDIAKSATDGDSAVRKLKSALADINDTSVRKLAAASAALTNALGRELSAVKSSAGAAERLATNKEKIATASRNATTAIRRETTAVNRLTSAYQAQAKAAADARSASGGGAGLPGAGAGSAGPSAGAGSAATDLKTLADAARGAATALRSIRPTSGPGGGSGGGSGAGGTGPSFARYGGVDFKSTGQSAELARHQVMNLGYQLNDVFVSLASGQKPLTVFIQQGAQIGQIYAQTGLTLGNFGKALTQMLGLTQTVTAATEAAALAAGRQAEANVAGANASALANVRAAETNIAVAEAQVAMATTANEAALAANRLALAQAELGVANGEAAITANALSAAQQRTAGASTAAAAATRTSLTALGTAGLAVGAIAAGLAIDVARINSEANKDGGIKKYAESLGLTHKEMKKLKDQTVTYGDTLSGLWTTIKETFEFGPMLKSAGKAFKDWFDQMNANGIKSLANLYGGFVGTYRAIVKTWALLPAALGDLAIQAANAIIKGIADAINKGIELINGLISYTNGLVPTINFRATAVEMKNQFAGAAKEVGDTFSSEVANATKQAEGSIKGFYSRWEKNSIKSARDRLRKGANAIIADRTPKKEKEDHTAENRAHALDVLNTKLDDELSRMKLLKDERAVQQRMDQIEEQLLQKKIKLNDAERASILGKVKAIEAFKYQQAEMDRITEEAIAPQRTYNAAMAAANDLRARGVITAQQLSQEQVKANRALAEATDPLFGLKEQLGESERAIGLYGDAIERNNQLEGIRATLLQKGIILGQNSTAAIDAEVAALLRRGDALRQQQYVQAQVGEVVNPILEQQKMLDNEKAMYAEIDRLRQAGVLSEEQAARARYALNAKFDEMRLASYGDLMGALAGLASSGNKKLAAIGKAAAIAQATYDGYVAVQKALASAPPPFNIIAAAATGIKTAINIAGIASTNVGSFNEGGSFTVRGTPGIDKNNINMNVSRGERVSIETKAQQRSSGVTVNIINASGAPVEKKETTNADGSTQVDVLIGKVKDAVAADIRKGGTNLNQAVEGRYGVNPARGNG